MYDGLSSCAIFLWVAAGVIGASNHGYTLSHGGQLAQERSESADGDNADVAFAQANPRVNSTSALPALAAPAAAGAAEQEHDRATPAICAATSVVVSAVTTCAAAEASPSSSTHRKRKAEVGRVQFVCLKI